MTYIAFSAIALSSSIFSLQAMAKEDNLVKETPHSECYFNRDPYNFSGVSVAHNGDTSYVSQSEVIFYLPNNGTVMKVPDSVYKGALRVSDAEGEIYEICLKKDALKNPHLEKTKESQ